MSENNYGDMRKAWRKRLVDAELPEEVVDTWLAALPDQDLLRMKDMEPAQFAEAVRQSLKEDMSDEEKKDEEEDKEEEEEATMKEDVATSLTALADAIASRVLKEIQVQLKELLGNVEVEVPELSTIIEGMQALKEDVDAIKASYGDLSTSFKEATATDTDRIRQMVSNLSPAQRARLRVSMGEVDTATRAAQFKSDADQAAAQQQQMPPLPAGTRIQPGSRIVVPPTTEDGAAIIDASGKTYKSLSEMAFAQQ